MLPKVYEEEEDEQWKVSKSWGWRAIAPFTWGTLREVKIQLWAWNSNSVVLVLIKRQINHWSNLQQKVMYLQVTAGDSCPHSHSNEDFLWHFSAEMSLTGFSLAVNMKTSRMKSRVKKSDVPVVQVWHWGRPVLFLMKQMKFPMEIRYSASTLRNKQKKFCPSADKLCKTL